ncbi:hypothetical protein BGY98DRAFT_1174236 [Russula aff. rugulosa BPL654]|nr:hypothetical protein BGY98DRAFT_1174236 [Russula aff. rugulosa BPL654]
MARLCLNVGLMPFKAEGFERRPRRSHGLGLMVATSLSSAILRRRALFKLVFQIDYAGRGGKPSKVLSTSASRALAGGPVQSVQMNSPDSESNIDHLACPVRWIAWQSGLCKRSQTRSACFYMIFGHDCSYMPEEQIFWPLQVSVIAYCLDTIALSDFGRNYSSSLSVWLPDSSYNSATVSNYARFYGWIDTYRESGIDSIKGGHL